MKQHRSYQLVAYDHSWPEQFERLSSELETVFSENLVRIEHIGSTSVPGLSAKPQIDVLVEVKSLADVKDVHFAMEAAGFTPRGDYNGALKDEEYFTKDSAEGVRLVSVHVYESGNPKIKRNLAFRNYLRSSPKEARRYEQAKIDLHNQFGDDYIAYRNGKNEIIFNINYQAARAGF